MISNKLKRRTGSGFTLVELLIVIVVIAILAAITIVAYGNISARAKTTQGSTAAANTVKVAEAINADDSAYPKTVASLAAGTQTQNDTKLPSGVGLVTFTANGFTANATASIASAFAAGTSATAGNTGLKWGTDGNAVAVAFLCTTTSTTTTAGTGPALGGVIYSYDFSAKAANTSITYFGQANSSSTVNSSCS